MPLQTQQALSTKGEYAIWEIEESENFFRSNLQLTSIEIEQVNKIKGDGRRLEWLASRYLIHLMSGRKVRAPFLKDEFGKPYLENSPFQISISHSNHIAAAIAAPFQVGIDIQKIVSKIERIVPKFMRAVEIESLQKDTRLEHIHVYWGAKEALYKAYGRRELDFRKHIFVEPFEFDLRKGRTIGQVKKGNYNTYFDLYYEQWGSFILVYALEQ